MEVIANISDRKVVLAHWLLELEDEQILQQIEELKRMSFGSWYDQLDEADKSSVARADADIAEGKTVDHAEVKKDIDKWLEE